VQIGSCLNEAVSMLIAIGLIAAGLLLKPTQLVERHIRKENEKKPKGKL